MHIDNASEDLANDFLNLYPTVVNIYNYDTSQFLPFQNKPPGINYLNVVLLATPLKFSPFLLNTDVVYSSDVIMFITDSASFKIFTKDFASLPNLNRSGGVVVVNFAKNVELYTICYYCGDVSGRLTSLQNVSYDHDLTKSNFSFTTKSKNFGGHLIKIIFGEYFPYMFCKKKSSKAEVTVCEEAVGSEIELLNTLSHKLNFTYQLIEDFDYDVLIEEVVSGKVDLGIGGISATTKRISSLRFSSVLRFEPLLLFYVYQKPLLSKLYEYEIANLVLEVFLLVVTLVLSVLVKVLLRKYLVQTKLMDIFMVLF